jgi:hypothetical protein
MLPPLSSSTEDVGFCGIFSEAVEIENGRGEQTLASGEQW